VISQIIAVAVTWVLAVVATFVILKVLDVTMDYGIQGDESRAWTPVNMAKKDIYLYKRPVWIIDSRLDRLLATGVKVENLRAQVPGLNNGIALFARVSINVVKYNSL